MNAKELLLQLAPAALAVVGCLVGMILINKLTAKLLGKTKKLDGTLKGFVQGAIKVLLWVLAVIIVCNTLGIDTTSLVAVVSVAGLALSLSLQNILSNVFSGLTLLINRPFKEGDYVDVGGKGGVVKKISLFYTQINTVDNVTIDIPNSDVTSASVMNYSTEPLRRVDQYFCASYDCEPEKVKAAILEAIFEDSRVLSDPEPFVRLFAYEDSCIKYVSRVWCKGSDYWGLYFDLNEAVFRSFKRNGIEMTYPHVNVHMLEK